MCTQSSCSHLLSLTKNFVAAGKAVTACPPETDHKLQETNDTTITTYTTAHPVNSNRERNTRRDPRLPDHIYSMEMDKENGDDDELARIATGTDCYRHIPGDKVDFLKVSHENAQYLIECLNHAASIKECMSNLPTITMAVQLLQAIDLETLRKFAEHKTEIEHFLQKKSSGDQPAELSLIDPNTATQMASVPTLKETDDVAMATQSSESSLNTQGDEGSSQLASKRKKRKATSVLSQDLLQEEQETERTDITAGSKDPPANVTQKTLSQAVLIRPTCKRDVKEFLPKHIKAAAHSTGVTSWNNIAIKYNEKANIIALVTKDKEAVERLTQITEIGTPDGALKVQALQAQAPNQCKGVAYFRYAKDDTNETILPELECRTHNILGVHIVGPMRSTAILTFEGNTRPQYIRYCGVTCKVYEYRPRPMVCLNCHAIGHKADICPSKIRRCGECGRAHKEGDNCGMPPECYNCKGPHTAMDKKCPKRAIPPPGKNLQQTKKAQTKHGIEQFSKDEYSWPLLPNTSDADTITPGASGKPWTMLVAGTSAGGKSLPPIKGNDPFSHIIKAERERIDEKLRSLEDKMTEMNAKITDLFKGMTGLIKAFNARA